MIPRLPMRRGRDFLACRSGSIAIAAALVAVPLLAALGLGIDLGRAYIVRQHLLYALDAAGLAAGSVIGSEQQAEILGKSYLAVNFQSSMGTLLAPTYSMTISDNVITTTATAQVNTTFMALMGQPSINVAATSQVTRSVKGVELAMVLDNTDSLFCCVGQNGNNQTNIQALKQAAGALALQLFGADTTDNPSLRVAVVPYNGAVNPVSVYIPTGSTSPAAFAAQLIAGATEPNYVKPVMPYYSYQAPAQDYSSAPDPAKWLGCVEETAAYKAVNAKSSVGQLQTALGSALEAPLGTASGGFTMFYNCAPGDSPNCGSSGNNWSSNWQTKPQKPTTHNVSPLRWASGTFPSGPNRGCPVPVLPLTNNRAPVLATLGVNADGTLIPTAGIDAWGGTGTNGAEGMAWAYRVLSPSGPYAGISTVNSWNAPNWVKAVVLMTDGANNYPAEYTGFGPPSSKYSATAVQNIEMATCDLLKSNGTVIFSVFLNSNSSPDSAIRYCAGTQSGVGDPNYYFLANSQSDLFNAFSNIGGQLSKLRVSR